MSIIFADSGCDILPKFIKDLDIKIITYPFTLENEEFLDVSNVDMAKFYEELKKGKISKTASLNPQIYAEIFEPYLKQGENIIYIHFSSGMSGTFVHCQTAVKELKEKYPNQNIDIIDSKNISAGAGLLAIEVAKRNLDGMPHNELVVWANQNKNQFSTYFYVDDLKFLKRGGRISSTTAIVGSMLQIKPVLHCTSEGTLKILCKAIGKRKAMAEMINYVKKNGKDLKDFPMFVLHCGDEENAEILKTMLQENLGPSIKIYVGIVGPTVGTHCGPGTVAVFFHGEQLIVE